MKNILFIGTGTMGSEMIINLSKKTSFKIDVYNRTYQRSKNLEQYGVNVIKEFPNECKYSYVFSMVSDVRASEEIFFTKYKLLDKLSNESTIVEFSTLSLKFVHKFSDEAKKRGIQFIDSPVSGSKPQAKDAKLRFYYSSVRGLDPVLEKLLHSMGTEIKYINEIGKGTVIKLCVNLMVASQWSSCVEAMFLSKRYGIDEREFMSKLTHSHANTGIISTKLNKLYLDSSKEIHARLYLLHKDLKYAQFLISNTKKKFEILSQVEKIYNRASHHGFREYDYAYLVSPFYDESNEAYDIYDRKQLFELCNNYILSVQWASYVEALEIIKMYDITEGVFNKIITSGMVSSVFMNRVIHNKTSSHSDLTEVSSKLSTADTMSKNVKLELSLLKIVAKLYNLIDNLYSKNDFLNLKKHYSK